MVGFLRRLSAAAVVGLLAFASAAPGSAAQSAPSGAVSGRLAITAGACDSGVSGSYFRMILPTGAASGPFVSNNDSACTDKSYTLLTPGTDGGLDVGGYQPEPSPAFDGNGNSLADRVIAPTSFEGVKFSASTNAKDPQTKSDVPAPSLTVDGSGAVAGDLRSFAASWNRQEFNQGAPKPDGSFPGNTAAAAGTLNGDGSITVEWSSQIVGGPFDRFTGVWHLEGTFTAPTDAGGQGDFATPASSAGNDGAPPVQPAGTNAASFAGAGAVASASTSSAAPKAGGTRAVAAPQGAVRGGVVVKSAPSSSAGSKVPAALGAIALIGLSAVALYARRDLLVRVKDPA